MDECKKETGKEKTGKKRRKCSTGIIFSNFHWDNGLFSLSQNFPLHVCFGKTVKHFFNKNIFFKKILTLL